MQMSPALLHEIACAIASYGAPAAARPSGPAGRVYLVRMRDAYSWLGAAQR